MKRYGQVIRIKEEKIEEYKQLHRAVWPEIQQLIHDCNMRNYSIYWKDNYLFAYFEYVGCDFEKDMRKMAQDAVNKKWWSYCNPCQEPLETRSEGEWWTTMEEVFHLD